MGNCMEACSPRSEDEAETTTTTTKSQGGGGGGGTGTGTGSVKVKILLTKGELQWLMLQLNDKGERRLEDVLNEMAWETGRNGGGAKAEWKPTLESIMEVPELHTFHTHTDDA